MQISAANLLASQQQAAVRPAQQQPANGAAFQAALNAKKTEATGGFEEMLFKQAPAQPKAPAAQAVTGQAQPYGSYQRPGSQLDIRI
ncbi:MAG TPA: hypothetical protein VHL34_01335 [Rhizomicrobium sp.]|nr:hypothetical protein [Rhizomicrobium sp.]